MHRYIKAARKLKEDGNLLIWCKYAGVDVKKLGNLIRQLKMQFKKMCQFIQRMDSQSFICEMFLLATLKLEILSNH